MNPKLFLLTLGLLMTATTYAQAPENEWGFINSVPDYENGIYFGVVSAVNDSVVYVTAKEGVFYKTTDGGQTWSTYQSGSEEDYVAMDFYDVHRGVAVGGHGALLTTTDAGAHWTSRNTGTTQDLTAICWNSLYDVWMVGAEGGIFHSTDMGDTWTIDSTTTHNQLNSIIVQNDTGFVAGNNGTLLKTTDNGNSWNPVDPGLEGGTPDLFSLVLKDSTVALIAGLVEKIGFGHPGYRYAGEKIWKSTDKGQTWSQFSTFTPGLKSMAIKSPSQIYTLSSMVLLCGGLQVIIDKYIAGVYDPSFEFSPGGGNNYSGKITLIGNTGYATLGPLLLKLHGGDAYYNGLDVEKFKTTAFKLYPNPVFKSLYLQFEESPSQNFSLQIYNLQGRKVMARKTIKNQISIPVENLNTGVYLLKILKNGHPFDTQKFIKK